MSAQPSLPASRADKATTAATCAAVRADIPQRLAPVTVTELVGSGRLSEILSWTASQTSFLGLLWIAVLLKLLTPPLPS